MVAGTLTSSLSVTFNNPTPAAPGASSVDPDDFGRAVATVGADKVLIAAPGGGGPGQTNAGLVFLFSTNGTRLMTFSEPAPIKHAYFGISVAALGLDRVIIGTFSSNAAGAAYLFGTNGALLATITNPAPRGFFDFSHFGRRVVALGTDKLMIGSDSGVYLCTTNGTLVTAITNSEGTYFGYVLAPMGEDRLIIGSLAVAAYLYSTNGTLLATFTNPAPPVFYEDFASAVAVVGKDKVLVGADGYTSSPYGGAAYLFSTNGALITVITNPTPANSDFFGTDLAAVGEDKLLIGAIGDDTFAGAAYLFSTNGTLLATITNSTRARPDSFGSGLAVLGEDKLFIGAPRHKAGTVYLFTLNSPVPPLRAERVAGGGVRISWPLPASGCLLDETTLPTASLWSQVPFPYDTNATEISITLPVAGSKFYRLRLP